MRLPFILSIISVSTVVADKHRLCCCNGPNIYNDATICQKEESQKVVDGAGGKFITSTRLWDWDLQKNLPLAGEGWVYLVLSCVAIVEGWQ